MTEIAWVIIGIVLVGFGGILLFGAPYLPSLRSQIITAFELLDLKPGQRLLEIGSGDGRVLRYAAERGIHAVGYEMNLFLVIYSRWRLRRYKHVDVVWANAWKKQWPPTDAVYVFGLKRLMPKVYTKIVQSNGKKVKLVSVGFPSASGNLQQETNGVFLYEVIPQ